MASHWLASPWRSQLGSQRDWIWRGWQVRYTYLRSPANASIDPISQGSGISTSPTSAPLVFIHGFGSAFPQWHSNLLPLSQSHTVYALDLVGFGASEKAAASYKVNFWVEQLYDFWRTFIGQPIVLVGHSLGALVTLAAAERHPEMVQSLILMTLPATRQELLPKHLQPLVGSIERLFASPLVIRLVFQWLRRPTVIRSILQRTYASSDRVTEEIVSTIAIAASDRGAARTLSRLSQAVTRPDYSPSAQALLPHVQQPILLLWGQQDRIVPLNRGRQLSETFEHLQFIEIPQAGHCLYDECADLVNAEILNWLKRDTAEFRNRTPVRE